MIIKYHPVQNHVSPGHSNPSTMRYAIHTFEKIDDSTADLTTTKSLGSKMIFLSRTLVSFFCFFKLRQENIHFATHNFSIGMRNLITLCLKHISGRYFLLAYIQFLFALSNAGHMWYLTFLTWIKPTLDSIHFYLSVSLRGGLAVFYG